MQDWIKQIYISYARDGNSLHNTVFMYDERNFAIVNRQDVSKFINTEWKVSDKLQWLINNFQESNNE